VHQVLELGPPNAFLAKALDPPDCAAVNAAVRGLIELGALAVVAAPGSGSGAGGGGAGKALALTSLGHHVSRLPLPPRLAKLLVLGALFGCEEACLTIAASLAERLPFAGPFDRRDSVRDAKCRLAGTSRSDHVAAVRAFDGWVKAGQQQHHQQPDQPAGQQAGPAVAVGVDGDGFVGPDCARRRFCRENWLSEPALVAMAQLRAQYRRMLAAAGFLPEGGGQARGGRRSGSGDGGDDDDDNDDEDEDSVSDDDDGALGGVGALRGRHAAVATPAWPAFAAAASDSLAAGRATVLVTSVLCAALCPGGVARVVPSRDPRKRGSAAVFTRTERVLVHPGSVNARGLGDPTSHGHGGGGRDAFLCFFAKQANAASPHAFLLDCSFVSPLAVLLLGGPLDVRRITGKADRAGGERGERPHAKAFSKRQGARCVVAVVGTGLAFEMPETAAVLVKVLRRSLEAHLAAAIAHPAALRLSASRQEKCATPPSRAAAAGTDPGYSGGGVSVSCISAAQQRIRLLLGATAEFLSFY